MEEYTIIRSTPDDHSTIESFMSEHFFPEMPVVQAFGLQDVSSPAPYSPSVFDLKAVDGQGNLIGVAVNKFNYTFDTSVETSPAMKEMVELLLFTEREAKLDKLPEKTIELRRLGVHKAWRGRGVARRLAEESALVARSLGFAGLRICCNSEFTAKMARSLGWREIYRMAYADYPALSGRQVQMKATPPHHHIYYFYTDL